jgi:2-hydroxychromene-2-carboxylate isomerase
MRIEYFFDFSCPYAYLGSTQIEEIASRHDAELVWKPMLLGGVFRAVETPMNLAASQLPAKTRHGAQDMMRWAELWKVPLHMPTAHPMRTVRALRTLLACPQNVWPKLIHALFAAYWIHGKEMSSPDTIAWALAEAGIEGELADVAMQANESEDRKQELRERTGEAIDRGVFGAPSIFLSGGHLSEPLMFWGQDRYTMTEAVLEGWTPGESSASYQPATEEAPEAKSTNDKHIDFWYDFSSPFAYLGAMRIEELARRCGATLSWKPLLLGALFKSVGTANVPLFAMSAPKRDYQIHDLKHWASWSGAPLRFASAFPLRTVTALRLALLAEDRIGELSTLLFRAAWAEDRNIGDHDVLLDILDSAGFEGKAMLEQCSDPAVKARLRQNTDEAMQLGVFGVPTSIITVAGESQLYWGQDRLALVERGLQ